MEVSGAPPEKGTPGRNEDPRWVDRVCGAVAPAMGPVVQALLGKEFDQLTQLADRLVEFDLAVRACIARGNLEDEERSRLDKALRALRRQDGSWQNTYDAVRAALAEAEQTLSGKYPESRIRASLVTVLYTGYIVASEPEEPFRVHEFDLYQPSPVSSFVRELMGFALDCAPQAAEPESTASPVYQLVTCRKEDQPIVIGRHVQFLSLVDPQLARTKNPEEMATELVRRAPPTATLCVTYEVLQPKAGQDTAGAVGELSLEVVKCRFACTPRGWQRSRSATQQRQP